MWDSGSRGRVSRDVLSGRALQGARQGRGSRRGCPRLTPWVWSVHSPETSCLEASHWLCGPIGVMGAGVGEAPPPWLRAFLQGRPAPDPENEGETQITMRAEDRHRGMGTWKSPRGWPPCQGEGTVGRGMGWRDEWLELDGGLGWAATINAPHLPHVIKSPSWREVRHRAGRAVAAGCAVHVEGTPARCSWGHHVGDAPGHQTAPLSLEQPEPIRSQVNNCSGRGTFITVSPERGARQGRE